MSWTCCTTVRPVLNSRYNSVAERGGGTTGWRQQLCNRAAARQRSSTQVDATVGATVTATVSASASQCSGAGVKPSPTSLSWGFPPHIASARLSFCTLLVFEIGGWATLSLSHPAPFRQAPSFFRLRFARDRTVRLAFFFSSSVRGYRPDGCVDRSNREPTTNGLPLRQAPRQSTD